MKKALSIISIIAGGLVLLGVATPLIIGLVLKAQSAASTVGIIGGADGPTAIMLVGTIGAGSVIVEIVIGVLLIGLGIWGLKKLKNSSCYH